MDLLTADTTGAAVILGVIAPWIIAVVNRPHWSGTVRSAVAIVVSAVLGGLICMGAGTFDEGWTVLTATATVLATSQAVYGRLFAGSQRLVECLTSPKPAPVEVVEDEPGRHAVDHA